MPAREVLLEYLLDLAGGPARTPSELADRVLRLALAMVDCEAAVMLTSRNRSCTRVGRHRGRERSELLGAPRDGTRFTRALARAGTPYATTDVGADPRIGPDDGCPGVGAGPALFVPLRLRERGPGYLAVYRPPDGDPFSRAEIRLVTLLSVCASLAIDHRRLAQDLERLAVTDDLTQVYNYRFLKTALRRELKRATRFHQPLSVVMIDVDNLKTYNDRNGHLRGSFLLKDLAALCAQQVRSFDVLAKYGGDEFTMILPQTPREGAMIVAERVRAAVAGHAFALVAAGEITVSLGVAAFPADGNDPTSLLQAADRALYAAKRNGRNRVESADAAGREAA
jgi:diguanylate cyclase (GGDEF)-like protein